MATVTSKCKNQHAYIPRSSTLTALVKARYSWLMAKDGCWVLLADMSKAFDRVHNAQLLQHLANTDLHSRPLAWVHSYMSG